MAMTQDQVAEALGITKNEVRQVEYSALKKLRGMLRHDPHARALLRALSTHREIAVPRQRAGMAA